MMATNMAKAMVTQYGMSEEMGPLAYGENEQEVFLGHSVARQPNMSEETQCKIDAEVRRLVEEGYEQAKSICQEKMDDLHAIAKGLLEYETLTGDEITGLLDARTAGSAMMHGQHSRCRRSCFSLPESGWSRWSVPEAQNLQGT